MSESLQAISPIDINQDVRDFFSPSPILEEDKLQSVKEQVWKLTFCALLHSLTHSILFVPLVTLGHLCFINDVSFLCTKWSTKFNICVWVRTIVFVLLDTV